MYLFKNKKNSTLILLYVDNLLITRLTFYDVKLVKRILLQYYKLREIGQVLEFLSIFVVRDRENH